MAVTLERADPLMSATASDAPIVACDLIDYGTPAFVTFMKTYVGFYDDMSLFLERRGRDAEVMEVEPVETYTARCLGAWRWSLGSASFVHDNIWGFPHDVAMRGVDCSVVWVEAKGRLGRYVKFSCDRVELMGKPVSFGWGQPGVLSVTDGGAVSTSLYLPEIKEFGSEADMRRDMSSPQAPDLSALMDEIMADG